MAQGVDYNDWNAKKCHNQKSDDQSAELLEHGAAIDVNIWIS